MPTLFVSRSRLEKMIVSDSSGPACPVPPTPRRSTLMRPSLSAEDSLSPESTRRLNELNREGWSSST